LDRLLCSCSDRHGRGLSWVWECGCRSGVDLSGCSVVGGHVEVGTKKTTGWAIHFPHVDVLVILAVPVHVFEVLELTWSEMTWSEGRSLMHVLMHLFFGLVMGSLHRLEAIASAEEAFNLWVVVIVMHGLDKLRMTILIILIVELIWKTSANVAVQLACRTGGSLHRLSSFEVQFHILIINVMIRIGIARHVARLICL